jgi:serine/threonine protein kinase
MTLCINPRCTQPENPDNAQFCQNCQSALLLKQRYRATKVLGAGGFGKTYDVSDLGTRNKVLKVLINNSPKAVELFQREAEFLSTHNSSGIPKAEKGSYFVFQPHDEQASVHCLVMEKIEGMNLRDYLKQSGHPIDSETAKRWLEELALILQEVHGQGILHRDIKPQNIIFKPDGTLALIDFGAVREGTGTEVATAAKGGTEVASHVAGGTSVVSVGYTAPEQMNGKALKQSDIYSLGKTCIFLLTGKEPSEIPYDPHEDILQWRKYAPGVESDLATLIEQMTSMLVRQRPASTQEILQKLNTFNYVKVNNQQNIEKYKQEVAARATLLSDHYTQHMLKQIQKDLGIEDSKALEIQEQIKTNQSQRMQSSSLDASQTKSMLNTEPQYVNRLEQLSHRATTSPRQKTSGKALATFGIGGGLVIFAIIAFASQSNVSRDNPPLSPTEISPVSTDGNGCIANVRGNVRTEPSDQAGNQTVIPLTNKSLAVTGLRAGEWIQVQLQDSNTGWASLKVISNASEIEPCISQSVDKAQFITSQPEPSNNSNNIPQTQRECEEQVGAGAWHNGQCVYDNIPEEVNYKDARHGGDLDACIQDVMTWQNQEWTYDLAHNFCLTPVSEIQSE